MTVLFFRQQTVQKAYTKLTQAASMLSVNKQNEVPEGKNIDLDEIEKLFCSFLSKEQQDLWPGGL